MFKKCCPHCEQEMSCNKLDSLFQCSHCFRSIAITEASGKYAITLDQFIKQDTRKEISKPSKSKTNSESKTFVKFSSLILIITLVILTFFIVMYGINSGADKDQDYVESETYNDLPSLYLRLADHKNAQKALEVFFSAQSAEEALQYVLPDPNLSSIFKMNWRPRSFKQIRAEVTLSRVLENKSGVIHFFNCKNEDGRSFNYPVYSFNGNSSYYVDWRVGEQIEDTTIENIVKKRLTGNYKIRCLVIQEDYYNYGYDPGEWVSLGCYNPNSSLESYISLKCFLSKKGSTYDQIFKAMKSESGRELNAMRYTEKQKGDLKNLLAPQNLYELKQKSELTNLRPYSHCILSIKVGEKNRGVAEIMGLVCVTLQEYFSLYQEPYLKALGVIKK